MMGSGGLIVMDEDNCMVDIASSSLNLQLMNPVVNVPLVV